MPLKLRRSILQLSSRSRRLWTRRERTSNLISPPSSFPSLDPHPWHPSSSCSSLHRKLTVSLSLSLLFHPSQFSSSPSAESRSRFRPSPRRSFFQPILEPETNGFHEGRFSFGCGRASVQEENVVGSCWSWSCSADGSKVGWEEPFGQDGWSSRKRE